MGWGIGIGIGWPNASAGISYAKKLIKAFKARVLSYPTSIFEAEACLDATLTELNAIGLLKEASLVITPNAYNEGILYDVVPNTTLGDMNVVRATTATRVNELGLIEVVPRNLLTYSNNFTNVAWSKDRVTISANSIISPDGNLNASKLNDTLQGNNAYRLYNSLTLLSQSYTQTFYAKAAEYDWVYVRIGNAQRAWFNISNGTIGTVNSGLLGSINSVGDGWYKITTTITTATAGGGFALIGLTNANNVETYTPTIGGQGIYIYGAQLEQGSTATSYFPTTTRLNIPRIDYTNGSCPSLLVEPQRTNLMIYSEQFENSIWAKSNISITANTVLSPSGIVNADTLTTSNPPSESFIRYSNFSITANVGSSYTTTVFAKKGTGNFLIIRNLFVQNGATSGKAWFNLNTGVIGTVESSQTASMQNMGDGWYRCTLTGIVGSLSNFNFIDFGLTDTNGSSSSSVSVNGYVWGAQLEQGSNATSYIPTIASTVTRNADVISKTGISSLIGQTEGTVFLDFYNTNSNINFDFEIKLTKNIVDTDYINTFISYNILYVNIRSNNISQFNTVSAVNINNRYKLCIVYKLNNLKIYLNGVLKVSSTSFNVPMTLDNLIFSNGNKQETINSTQLYKTALTDTECIALTTL